MDATDKQDLTSFLPMFSTQKTNSENPSNQCHLCSILLLLN